MREEAARVLARRWRPVGLAALLAVAVVYPLVSGSALNTLFAVNTLIYVAAVSGWNIFSGYSGYISLGHAVFFGTGAYTAGLLALHQHLTGDVMFATLPLGGLTAAAVAVPFGLIALRVRRHTFVVVTIAVFFIFQLMAFNFAFTKGNMGVSAPFLNWDPATYNDPFYYAALIIAVAAVALSWQIRGSAFGLRLRAIKDDEDRARGLGVRAMRTKLTAFVISAFIIGIVGGLWFYLVGQALPETVFDPAFDLTVALMGFLGGFGTLAGPVLGALILEPVQQQLTIQFTNGYLSEILLGGLFLVVIVFLPRGLIPSATEWLTAGRAWQARRRPATKRGAGPSPPAGAGSASGAQGAQGAGTAAGTATGTATGTGTGTGSQGGAR
ncbi:MAG TPA: branched-chain amino acid ABC transporter permease [Streptosporangiaceae bacterium]|nr:branched-chain amino acid ABC transporter permease [Streptosporangiaceae bacterium]